MVFIAPYNPAWSEMFEEEKAHLYACVPVGLLRRIEHFGSTAIPGMAAKPIIDMLIEVSSLDETKEKIVPLLLAQRYEYFWRPTFGENIPPFYAWFIKRNARGARTHHLHMVERDFEHWDRLLFRDYLRAHPETAKKYQALKLRCAQESGGNRVDYTRRKSDFIEKVTHTAKEYFRDRET